MRIRRYLHSLRIRIALVFISLGLISALIYSIFAWLIYEVSDDRLFNWHILSINQHAIKQQVVPVASFNRFAVIGDEQKLTNELIKRFDITSKHTNPVKLADVFNITQTSNYAQGHKILDIDDEHAGIELHIVESPWQQHKLYMVYDVSAFETAAEPTNLYSDTFLLLVLVPIAVVITILALLFSAGLTQTILKPLIRLSSKLTSASPEHLSHPLTEHYYPDEVGELATTFNLFIARIEKYIENEKRFSREVSHELRTPTTSLTIALELFENTDLTDRQTQLLARMKRANNDMTQLINTFIWLAKNAPQNAPQEPVKLFSSIEQTIEKLGYLLENKDVMMLNKVDKAQLLTVSPPLFEIVLNNLLRNALQFTSKGQIEILSTQHSLTIKDTGVGIPAEEIKNIEQAFYSLQPDGIGLGLSIVQRIVQKLGWQLQITSTAQYGTDVVVVFSTDANRS